MAGKVKGKYIHPISPTMWVDEAKHVTFIFHKTKLQELTAVLITTIGRQGLPELSKMSGTSSFPYQSSEGKLLDLHTIQLLMFSTGEQACFLAELPNDE